MGNPNLLVSKVDPSADKRGLVLGISDERADELFKISQNALEATEDIIEATIKASESVNNANELVFVAQYLESLYIRLQSVMSGKESLLRSLLDKALDKSLNTTSDNQL